jgi:hypothetical protein
MTLLTICQNVARSTRIQVPDTIIGNSELEAVQLLRAITSTINDLLEKHDWQELQAQATINTVASTEAYSLPSDFHRIIDETAWNNTLKYKMVGAVSPQEWQDFKNRTDGSGSATDYYRIRGGQFLVYPTPSSVEVLVYEYIQNTPVESSVGTAQETWLADSDVPRIDDFLVELGTEWRFRKTLGKPYQEDLVQYNQILNDKKSSDGGHRTIHAKVPPPRGVQIAYPEVVVP